MDEIQPSYEFQKLPAQTRVGGDLDCIDRGLGALDSAEGIEFGTYGDLYNSGLEFEPVGEGGTQVELTFSTPANPFGDGFDEEEIVIDHYATLAANHLSDMLDDQDGVGGIAAQILELARQSAAVARPAAELPSISSELEEQQPAREATKVAALEPVLPEADFSEPLRVHVENPAESEGFDPASDPVLPEENNVTRRDEPRRPLGGTPRPKRREYRTLFSTLRNR